MDILFFLNRRIAFISQLYGTASAPYQERKRKIEAKEEPYVQPYSEDSEPAFLVEWIEADESLQVLAYSWISMLAASLHLFFEAWISESRVKIDESLKKSAFKNGWLAGYQAHFLKHFGIDFVKGPAKLELIKEIILARNRISHPPCITVHKPQYEKSDLDKLQHPFFIDEQEVAFRALTDNDEKRWLMPPTLHVTEDQLYTAIDEVTRFAEWFEGEMRPLLGRQ